MKKPNTTGDEEKRRILENDPLTDGVEEARCRCRVCGTWIELGSIPQIQLVNWADHCKKYHSSGDAGNSHAATSALIPSIAPHGSARRLRYPVGASTVFKGPEHASDALVSQPAVAPESPEPPPRDAISAFLQNDPLVGNYTSSSAFCVGCQKSISTGHRLNKWHAHCMRPVHGRTKEEIARMQEKLTRHDVVTSRSLEVNDSTRHGNAEPRLHQVDLLPPPEDYKSDVFHASKRVQAQARYLELDYDPLAVMLPGSMVHCTECQRRYQAGYWRAHCRDVHERTESEETQLIMRARAAAQEAEMVHQRNEITRRNSIRQVPVPKNFNLRWIGMSNRLVARARQLEYELDPLGEVEQEGFIRCNECDKKLAFGSWRFHCKEMHHRSDEDHAQLVIRARAIAQGHPDPALPSDCSGDRAPRDAESYDEEPAAEEESDLTDMSSSSALSFSYSASQQSDHQWGHVSFDLRDATFQQHLIDHDPCVRAVDVERQQIICDRCDIAVVINGSRQSASLQFWNHHCMRCHERTREDVNVIMGFLSNSLKVGQIRPERGTKRSSSGNRGPPFTKRRRIMTHSAGAGKEEKESGYVAGRMGTLHVDTQRTDASSLSPLSSITELQQDIQPSVSSHNLANYIGVTASDESKRQAAFLFFLWTHNALAKIAYQRQQCELAAAAAGRNFEDEETT